MSYLSPFAQLVKKLMPSSSVANSSEIDSTKALIPDESSDLSRIMAAIREKMPVVLVHGRAGTGKTTLIQKIKRSGIRHAIVAPTGIAAVNAGGQTIHSFFGIKPGIVNLTDIQSSGRLNSIVSRLDLIIIDEISMVRADLLDAIDKTLRVNRGIDAAFGGVQMLMVGDFLQLPPIINEVDSEILAKRGYEVFYAFGAKCLNDVRVKIIELSTVYRQSDPQFLELLGDTRLGKNLANIVQELNRLCNRDHRSCAIPVVLTGTKKSSEFHNRSGLASLLGDSSFYRGTIQNKFNVAALPAPEHLELKLDARIMMVKNDPGRRWVNGSLGSRTRLSSERVWVRIDGTEVEHQVDQATWEAVEYKSDPASHNVRAAIVGTYSQLPIQLAWAITVHKSQGLTLDDVRLDLGSGAFSNGQTYVALSRARTLEGLSFGRPIKISDILVDEVLVAGVQGMVANATSPQAT